MGRTLLGVEGGSPSEPQESLRPDDRDRRGGNARDDLESERAIPRLQRGLERLGSQLEGLDQGVANLERHQQRTELHARIQPTMTWIEQVDVAPEVLISVILPTRDRVDVLQHAVRSVLQQRYPRWELIVVDDGSTDGTAPWLRTVGDDRLVSVRTEVSNGVGVARNLGLDKSGGVVVCYLDDDNLMHPGWLKAIAWAWSRRPDLEVVYGARMVEDAAELGIGAEGLFTPVHFEPFDRRRLEEGNFIDLGVLAHRRDLPEARFDEDLDALEDWDLILRLTQDRSPVALPVIAVLYTTSEPGRLSDSPEKAGRIERVRARIRERRGPAGPAG